MLLCPARLVDFKNHAALLRAFAGVTARAELWLAGDGPLREVVLQQIEALGLRSVRLLGALPQERLMQLYRERRVAAAILASTDEGIPVSLMEAMAAGVPVIATAVGGVPELVGMGAGMLVPAGDETRLTWAMEELLRDPALRARLGQAGRARVARRFSIDRSVDRLARRFAAHVHGPAGNLSIEGIANLTNAAYSDTYASASAAVATASSAVSRHASSAGTTAPNSSGAA